MPTYNVQKARPPPDNIDEAVRIPRRREVVAEAVVLAVTTVLMAANTILSLLSWWGDPHSLRMGRGTRAALTEHFSVTTFSPASWSYVAWVLTFVAQFAWLGHWWSYTCRQRVIRASSLLAHPFVWLASLVNVGYVYAVGHVATQLSLALIAVEALAFCACVGLVAFSLRRKDTGLDDLKPFDKWATRVLALNGLSLTAAWAVVCTLFHLSSILAEDTNLHGDTIATCLLSLLAAITIGYFLLEATILDRYLRWVVIVYPAVAWWVGGVLALGEFSDISRNNLFAFVLLVAVCGLFVVRLVLVVLFGCFRPLVGGGGREGIALIPY